MKQKHKWVEVETNHYKCEKCGIEKKNVWMGMKNGKAAIYFRKDGSRTSFRPECVVNFISINPRSVCDCKGMYSRAEIE